MLPSFSHEMAYVNTLADLVGRGSRADLSSPTTVIQYAGPPRSGTDELLDKIRDRYARWTPVAVYDFADTGPDTRNDKILNLLCFLLSEPREGFKQLAFPRLLSVLLAMRQAPERPDRDTAVRDIQHLLEDEQAVAWVKQAVQALADDATSLLPSLPGRQPPGAATARAVAPDMVLAALRNNPRGWRVLSRKARSGLGRWPGMITDSKQRDIDELEAVKHTLAALSVFTGSGQMAQIEEAERQPWAAFLQDIRAGYPGERRNLRTILILRNVDLPAGQRFIRALADEYARRKRLGGDNVPLLVLAAGGQPVAVDSLALKVEIRRPPALSPADVRELRHFNGAIGVTAAQEAISVLSGGHQGIAEDMLRYCQARRTSYPYALTPGVALRENLLPDVTEQVFQELVSWAPAIDISQLERVSEKSGTQLPSSQVSQVLGDLGWLRGNEIHPGLRTILLRHLAWRPAEHHWPWEKACQRLREEPPDQMQVTEKSLPTRRATSLTSRDNRVAANRAYYDLAAGNIKEAVAALEGIGTADPEWTAAFDWAIAAPQRYRVSEDPGQLVRRLADEAIKAAAGSDRHAQLIRLVVTCWLAADRQLDPWHELDQDIANCYRVVRPLGGDLFAERAGRYAEEAERWRRSMRENHPRPERDDIP